MRRRAGPAFRATIIALLAVVSGAPALAPSVATAAGGGDPFGQVDELVVVPGTVSARGWAIDPDTSAAVIVQLYVDGAQHRLGWANLSRPDVAAVYPGMGDAHGYEIPMAVPGGSHRVCVYAINVGSGASQGLGCRTVDVPGVDPMGRLDRVTAEPGRVVAHGWAADPDAGSPVLVQVYVDWRTYGLGRAGESRPDVGAVHTWAGSNRGFTVVLDAPAGVHTVCAYAVNVGPGASRQLGCSRVNVPGHDPIGNVERLVVDGGRVSASGWAIDPDTRSPVIVQMFVESGRYTMTWASAPRADVGSVYPWAGANHGYTIAMDVPVGAHKVCLYAVNTGPGASRGLGCRWVSGPPFFVYGSLRTGQSGYHLLAGRTTSQTLTGMPGLDMYRRSGSAYPYAVPNAASATGIVGEVMQVHPAAYGSTVADLDRYERYNPGLPPDNQVYVRELRGSRDGLPSWVYVAGPRQSQYLRSVGILVATGDFLRW